METVGLTVGTLNFGTMTGRGRELSDIMQRRKVDAVCVQDPGGRAARLNALEQGSTGMLEKGTEVTRM